MRKIESELIAAIQTGRALNKQNTTYDPTAGRVTLHGHTVAERDADGWRFTFAGYATSTTRSRVNAVRAALGLGAVGIKGGCISTPAGLIGARAWFSA